MYCVGNFVKINKQYCLINVLRYEVGWLFPENELDISNDQLLLILV